VNSHLLRVAALVRTPPTRPPPAQRGLDLATEFMYERPGHFDWEVLADAEFYEWLDTAHTAALAAIDASAEPANDTALSAA
jgi:hypothetical protein